MINHFGHFDRVGGPGFSSQAERRRPWRSTHPAFRASGSHYIPASVLGGGRNDAGRVSFHSDGRGGRVFNFKSSLMAVWREDADAFRRLRSGVSSTNERLPRRLKLRPRKRGPMKAVTRRN